MDKELHIWMGMSHPTGMAISLEETEYQLNNNEERVDTPQTHVCSTKWIKAGYKIFVHMLDGKTVEMKLGYIEGYPKEIRVAHNLEKLLLANVFGKARREKRRWKMMDKNELLKIKEEFKELAKNNSNVPVITARQVADNTINVFNRIKRNLATIDIVIICRNFNWGVKVRWEERKQMKNG